MDIFRSFLKVGLVLLILISCVVLMLELPVTYSGIVSMVEPLKNIAVNVIELSETNKPAVFTKETGMGAGGFEHGNGPPDWAPEEAKRGYEWSQSGQEGPPPWAPQEAHRGYERSQSGDGGPPPWAPAHARERYEWSQSGEEGPPPWAGNKGKPE